MQHRLSDGADVHIRPVQADDAALLAEGFARLSTETRELRFLTRKSELTASELRVLHRGGSAQPDWVRDSALCCAPSAVSSSSHHHISAPS